MAAAAAHCHNKRRRLSGQTRELDRVGIAPAVNEVPVVAGRVAALVLVR